MSFISQIFAGGAEGLLGGVGKIIGTLKADPTEVIKLESALAQAKLQLTVQLAQADAQAIAAVNATMQAEAKSEQWIQYAWRPIFGFSGAAILVNNYLLLPYFAPLGILPLPIPSEVWVMIMTVLGVAAWTRGQEKIEAIRK